MPAPPSPTVSFAPGDSPAPPLRPYRLPLAALLARVFALDVTVCPDCGGRPRLIAALTDPVSVRRYLHGVGLPTEPMPILPLEPHTSTRGTHNSILDATSPAVPPRGTAYPLEVRLAPAPLNLKHPFSSIGPVAPKRGAAERRTPGCKEGDQTPI